MTLKAIATDALLASDTHSELQGAASNRNSRALDKAINIVERAVHADLNSVGPSASARKLSSLGKIRQNRASGTERVDLLFMPGELNVAYLALPEGIKLFASASNPGAAEAAHELQSHFPSLVITVTPPHWLQDIRSHLQVGSRVSHRRHGDGVVTSMERHQSHPRHGDRAMPSVQHQKAQHRERMCALLPAHESQQSSVNAVNVAGQEEGQPPESSAMDSAARSSCSQRPTRWNGARRLSLMSRFFTLPHKIHSVNVKFASGETCLTSSTLMQTVDGGTYGGTGETPNFGVIG